MPWVDEFACQRIAAWHRGVLPIALVLLLLLGIVVRSAPMLHCAWAVNSGNIMVMKGTSPQGDDTVGRTDVWKKASIWFAQGQGSEGICSLAWFGAGRLALLAGQAVDAVTYLDHAATLNPRHALTRHWLGEAFKSLGRYDDAVVQYRLAGSAQYLVKQFEKLRDQGEPTESLLDLRLAARVDPQSTEILYILADTYYGLRQVPEAIQTYRDVLALDHQSSFRRTLAEARLLLLEGQVSDAIARYWQLVQAYPDEPIAYRDLAMALIYVKGDKITGISVLEQLVARQPRESVWNYILIGDGYMGLGEVSSAFDWFRRATDVFPNSGVAASALGSYYLNDKDLTRARYWFDKAIDLTPNNPDAYYGLARLATGAGDLDTAISLLRRVVQLAPLNSSYHRELGLAYMQKKEYALAIQELRLTLDLDSGDELARQALQRLDVP